MDISSELDRLLPASLEESTLSKIVDEFLLFLHRLTKGEYESVLTLLPDSPSFNSLPTTAQSWGDSSTGLTTSTPKDSFVDLICYYSIQFYAATHVPPIEVIWHLLKRIRGRKPGNGLRRLAKMMSRREREGLFEELIALDLNDKESYGIVDEFVDYLESLFKGDRPGMIDIALEELLKQYEKKRTSPKYLVKDHLEEYILKKIQANRRNDPNRLPAKIKNVREARFVVEEVHRELIVYSTT